ncbi:MAG: DNA primase catalytic subunit PriS [Candidatus Methanarcanum hacksteinii]|uniref:DNA primase catalytic subunit PriS n=1 Tax=Candidatus Methanarcanum hacksteinii TaxID=2911857 RepID=UPI002A8B48D6|nr:DNA primase catalytic subunit PriS [Candidatus Methanarcanum hacksteinii]
MDQNSRFLLKMFRRYYKENEMPMPSRFGRREFGFMYFDRDFMQRHMSFSNPTEMRKFMIAQVPKHSYYSTAYYRRPNAPTMEEKGWMGADLIFDLDADHLEGAEDMSYSQMMDQIKKEMINLLDSFLYNDLGFDEKDVGIYFSGGRGYHAHIELNDVTGLGSHERREIVDFVTSNGLDIDRVFRQENVVRSVVNVKGQERNNISTFRTIPPEDSGGWWLRMRNGLKDVVNDVCDQDTKDLKRTYPSIKSMSPKTIESYKDDLIKSRDVIFVNNRMATLKKGTQDMLIKIMKEDVAYRLSGEVDEPVTADIKRLIRLPGSLHGKTGLKVMPITRDELNGFDPLLDALPESYTSDPITVNVKRKTDIKINGERFDLDIGVTEVPEYAAVFLVGRRIADIGDGEKNDSFF